MAEWSNAKGRDADGPLSGRGQRLIDVDGRRALVFWRSSGARSALLAAFPDSFFGVAAASGAARHLTDPEGQPAAGPAAPSGRTMSRRIGTSEYPWTLHVWPAEAAASATPGAGRPDRRVTKTRSSTDPP